MSGLNGARVAILEARMSSELAELIRRQNGEPICAPAVREAPLDGADQVAQIIDGLEQGAIQVIIFLTGVGVKALFREAEQLGRLPQLLDALKRITTVCRGPKPVAVLQRHNVPISLKAPEPHTTTELLQTLAALDLAEKGVALLHYGERNAELAEALKARGARLQELYLYEWLLPENVKPLEELIEEIISGRVDAITITSKVQAIHLFHIATRLGRTAKLVEALNTRTIVVAVGPTSAETLRSLGVVPQVVPEHPKMGPMVLALVRFIEQQQEKSSSE
jgi:uroporphyrinogen-III synthase